MEQVLFNNEIINKSDIKLDIEDRGYQFGDGIYEVVAIYNGKSFRMKEHLQRLERSAKEIGLRIGKTIESLEKQLEELISINKVENGIVYLQVTRGVAPRAHHFPPEDTPPVIVAYTREMERPISIQKEGVNCILTEDIRWSRCDIKTLNLLGSVMARQKAIEQNCYEAILHRGDIITEGSATNLFIVKDEVLYTHPANNFILNGITRSTVIEVCNRENIKVIEAPFNKNQLLSADEAFLAGTYIDIVPVNKVDNHVIGSGHPGKVTTFLQEKFSELIEKGS